MPAPLARPVLSFRRTVLIWAILIASFIFHRWLLDSRLDAAFAQQAAIAHARGELATPYDLNHQPSEDAPDNGAGLLLRAAAGMWPRLIDDRQREHELDRDLTLIHAARQRPLIRFRTFVLQVSNRPLILPSANYANYFPGRFPWSWDGFTNLLDALAERVPVDFSAERDGKVVEDLRDMVAVDHAGLIRLNTQSNLRDSSYAVLRYIPLLRAVRNAASNQSAESIATAAQHRALLADLSDESCYRRALAGAFERQRIAILCNLQAEADANLRGPDTHRPYALKALFDCPDTGWLRTYLINSFFLNRKRQYLDLLRDINGMDFGSELSFVCDNRCRPLDDGGPDVVAAVGVEDQVPHGDSLQPKLAQQRLAAQAVRAALHRLEPDSSK
jgi:hypothetical protein